MEQQGTNPPFIVTDGLTKTYIRREKPENGGITRLWRRETREVQALRDVSFRIGRGELVGLIGPNGAGKSTLVKLMTGILTPTSGSCTVDGRTPWAERKAHVRSLGAVFGQRMQLWWDVPIRDSFDLLRDIYSIDEGRYRHRLDELTAALGGLVTQAFFGLLYVFLYTALFRGENQAELAETITYVWLQQMFFRVLLMNDTELIQQVMTGGLAYAVLRPVDQYRFAFVRNMAQRHVNALMRLVPMIALQFLLPTAWRMQPPESLLALMQAFVSLLIGVMNLCAIAGISGAILMQTMDNRGINAIITFISNAFAGNIIPLTLFPDSVQAIIRYQPFAQSLDAPIRMYLHAQAAGEWALNIGVQLLWLMLLVALGRRMWRYQLNQLTIQGG